MARAKGYFVFKKNWNEVKESCNVLHQKDEWHGLVDHAFLCV